MSTMPKTTYRFNAILIKLSMKIFLEMKKKFWNSYGNIKAIPSWERRKKTDKGIKVAEFKVYYKAVVIKTV
jgi:hypothetical protein